MSTSKRRDHDSIVSLVTAVESIQDTLEDFDDRLSAVEEAVEDDADTNDDAVQDDEQDDAVQDDEQDGDEQDEIPDLREDLEEVTQRVDALSRGLSTAHESIEAVEDRLDGDEPHTSGGEDTDSGPSVTAETPLEQTASLPQQLLDEENPNTRRAMFVARNITDFASKVPAGRAITSSELKKVLVAGTECDGHSQTRDRVIRILDTMGKDDVKVVKRRGQRRVVFEDELCHRLEQLTEVDQDGNHAVVIPQEA